jgi:Asp-tRNA(Asn)/Glu-tRNA(Gln) amidotransferase A subunit family amidase
VLIGKTTTPEFGWKAIGDSPHRHHPQPVEPERTPGGSSAGAAVAAATGMGPLHLASDGGGSIRIPSSFTGVFGIKPTYWPRGDVAAEPIRGRLARRAYDAHGGGRGPDALGHRRLGRARSLRIAAGQTRLSRRN